MSRPSTFEPRLPDEVMAQREGALEHPDEETGLGWRCGVVARPPPTWPITVLRDRGHLGRGR
jgi:hypothetical protein